jgi:site-specific recombinase XerD
MAGVDLTSVKELLGHKTLNMTMRYAHLAPSHKVRAVNILDGENGVKQNAMR